MSRKRRVGLVVAVVAFCLGVILMRVFWDGRAALADGDRAKAAGDVAEAVAKWRRAARWYAPGAPHVQSAYDRLTGLALLAEGAGDRELALSAWQAVRSSILSTRSFYTPYSDLLPVANDKIAALMAQVEGPAADPGHDEAARKAWHLALLTRDESPSVFWSLVALFGFAAWVGGGFYFAWKGITPDDRLDRRASALSGIFVLVGLLVWMLGLYRA
jgi:hypothetical protein